MKSTCRVFTLSLFFCWAVAAAGQNSGKTVLAAPFAAGDGKGVFLIITDIHFNPFDDPKLVQKLDASPLDEWSAIFESSSKSRFAQYGSDANYPLMMSAIEAAGSLKIPYDFVLYPGDYLSHDFNQTYRYYTGGDKGLAEFVEKTVRFVGERLHNAFPKAPIISTLGNNDSLCGDYMIAPESPLLAALAPVWGKMAGTPDAFKDFPVGGFYAMPHPTVPKHKLVVLNDIFWSVKYADNCNMDGGDPGAAQLAWLHWTLYRIQQQGHTASLLMHVPPGINAYSSSKGFGDCRSSVTRFWAKRYSDSFQDIVRQYSTVLGNGYAGHTHMDDFRVLSDSAGSPFMFTHMTPAVSPIFGNNPAFTIVLYDKSTGEILNYATFYLTNLEEAGEGGNVARWSIEYVFTAAYGLDSVTPETVAKLSQQIRGDTNIRKQYMDFYATKTSAKPPITKDNWTAYQCAQTEITADAFAECYCDSGKLQLVPLQ